MKTVKALQTLHGSYGVKRKGEHFEVHDTTAEKLLEKNLVSLVEDHGKDTVTEQQHVEHETVKKNAAIDVKRNKKLRKTK